MPTVYLVFCGARDLESGGFIAALVHGLRPMRMDAKGAVTRDMILGSLSARLSPLEHVKAFWEGGAPGFGRLDEWSDMDLYALVDDGCVDDTFEAIEEALASLSPISIKYDIGQTPYTGVYQCFYRLERTSEFLLLDVAVVTMSAPDKFFEEEMHGRPSFVFSRLGGYTLPVLDRAALRDRVAKRVGRLRLRMDMFHVFVPKELNRGHPVEALDAYRVIVLGSLTELLRIRHNPVHHEFQTRYLYSELPPEVMRRLEGLYFVRDVEDIARKCASARAWFYELCEEIESVGVGGLPGL